MTLTPVSIIAQVLGHCVVQCTFKGRRPSVNENQAANFAALATVLEGISTLSLASVSTTLRTKGKTGRGEAQATMKGSYFCGLQVTWFQYQANLSAPLPARVAPRNQHGSLPRAGIREFRLQEPTTTPRGNTALGFTAPSAPRKTVLVTLRATPPLSANEEQKPRRDFFR